MRYPLDNFKGVYNSNNPFGYSSEEMKKYYVSTWSHIGCDLAVPSGTPVYAPCDGEMFKVEVSAPKGNVGIFLFSFDGTEYAFEICHLRELPKLGKYREGDIIARTGNTGSATTGAHLHCVIHRDGKVTANYQELLAGAKGKAGRDRFLRMVAEGKLIDPYEFFTSRVGDNKKNTCPTCNQQI